jgi:hypothetical protein
MVDASTPSGANVVLEATAERVDLGASVVPRATLAVATIDAMYRLYSRHYLDTTRATFDRDLKAKTHVLLLTTGAGDVCGFSTLQLYSSEAPGYPVRVLYSGDTIVDPRVWGSAALAVEWLRFAGHVARQQPDTPLYWLLIVKGHRTYRFLPTFARRYVPHHNGLATADDRKLLTALALEKFGASFDDATGIVRFSTPQGRLNGALADVSEQHRRLPAVAYFLQRNPGYRDGDELVCLCELAVANLKPFAARAFAPPDACAQVA